MKYNKNFVIWVNRNYQNFFDNWIEKNKKDGSEVNPYTTTNSFLTWDKMVEKYKLRDSKE